MAAHHLQLLERAVKRLPASADLGAPNPESSASPSWHVLNAHLDWALPTLLQMTANLHALSTPAVSCPCHSTALSLQISRGHPILLERQQSGQPTFSVPGFCKPKEHIKVPQQPCLRRGK